jgi:hypothetical protein
MRKEYNYSYDKVYINCFEATEQMKFKITKENISEGLILFEVGWSLLSFGEKFKIVITKINASTTSVEVSSQATVGIQIIDWGKNNNNVTGFFETLNGLLKK